MNPTAKQKRSSRSRFTSTNHFQTGGKALQEGAQTAQQRQLCDRQAQGSSLEKLHVRSLVLTTYLWGYANLNVVLGVCFQETLARSAVCVVLDVTD